MQMHIWLELFITSIHFIPIKIFFFAIFVLLMSDHQFLFGFVFPPLPLLWKMWKIVDGQ